MNHAYQELYLTCFPEDTPQDAAHLFEQVFSKAVCIDRKENGRPIAMLFLMDCTLVSETEALPFYYLYAACTHPDHRGKGIMGELLAEAKQVAQANGKKGIFLKPANLPLFGFYKKSGFLPFFKVCKLQTTAVPFVSACDMLISATKHTATPCTMDEWYGIRKTILPHCADLYADFPKSLLLGATDGCTALHIGTQAGLAYECREDTLLIKEALCAPNAQTDLLLAVVALLQQTGCNRLELRLPSTAYTPLLQRFGAAIEPFSVIWWAEPQSVTVSDPYHGFAFD